MTKDDDASSKVHLRSPFRPFPRLWFTSWLGSPLGFSPSFTPRRYQRRMWEWEQALDTCLSRSLRCSSYSYQSDFVSHPVRSFPCLWLPSWRGSLLGFSLPASHPAVTSDAWGGGNRRWTLAWVEAYDAPPTCTERPRVALRLTCIIHKGVGQQGRRSSDTTRRFSRREGAFQPAVRDRICAPAVRHW